MYIVPPKFATNRNARQTAGAEPLAHVDLTVTPEGGVGAGTS